MASKKMTIAFLQGGIIPAAILNLAKDRHCDAREPIEVPEFYGKSLIQDRIAIPAELPSAVVEKPKASTNNRSTPKSKEPAPAAAPTPDQPDPGIVTLIGSNILPDQVEIAPGKSVPLGEIVAKAHEKSGLSIEDWNALPQADRDALLTATVDELKAEASQQQP
ncbi:hypothetical protein [Rhizobium sp. FKY42]|uniref:hypothetical protein n=1 Tax=Rhizobium sp. FKY42 TaxID=2562310 RepID=UPI0010C00111|nr:hypothetical protein [Rhizobium sp. FKY42]